MKKERWKKAQKYEKEWWESHWKKLPKKLRDLSKDYWSFHLKVLKKIFPIDKKTEVLEIGGGANPFINYLPESKKYVLDPLMDYYIENFKLPKKIKWIKGVGEDMPFKKNYFDVIICANTLDHVKNPKKVLLEINRVLKKKGKVYLTVDCYNPLFKKYRTFREKFGVGDPCHPYSFSFNDIKNLIKDLEFEIIHLQKGIGDLGDYVDEKKGDETIQQKNIMKTLSASITKILISVINLILREKHQKDFIFVFSKR